MPIPDREIIIISYMPNTKVSTESQTTKLNLKTLIEPIQSDFAKVEEWLHTNLINDNLLISELLALVFQAGGKRIRPLLVLHSSRATLAPDSEFSRLHIILAVLTELIHTASLVHDDILDSASVRRGSQTINKRFNDRLAVLLGDLLFAEASICLAKIMNPVIVGIYGQVLGDLCAGEIQQMKQQFSLTITWQDYINKSISKTASLFSAGTHSGAILNGANNETIDALKNYGLHLGICFQIIDDLLDFTGTTESLGKEPGSDLKAGIITAPALFVLERKDKAAIRLEELINSREICNPDGLLIAMDLIMQNNGINATIELANKHGQIAIDSLQILPDSVYKNCLTDFVHYVLHRVN